MNLNQMNPTRNHWMLIGISLVLCSCTTNKYSKEISQFDNAIVTTQKAVVEYMGSTREAQSWAQIEFANSINASIDFNARNCKIEMPVESCTALVTTPTDEPRDLTVKAVGGNQTQLMDELKNYSKALADVVDANSSDELGKSIDELGSAIKAMKKEDVEFGNVTEPVTALVKWIGMQYMEYKKLAILKRAVAIAHPKVEESMDTIKKSLEDAYVSTLEANVSKISNAVDYYQKFAHEARDIKNSRTTTQLEDHIKAERLVTLTVHKEELATKISSLIKDYKHLRGSAPIALPGQLVSSHRLLKMHLENNDLDIKSLGAEMKNLYNHANDVYKAIKEHNAK